MTIDLTLRLGTEEEKERVNITMDGNFRKEVRIGIITIGFESGVSRVWVGRRQDQNQARILFEPDPK